MMFSILPVPMSDYAFDKALIQNQQTLKDQLANHYFCASSYWFTNQDYTLLIPPGGQGMKVYRKSDDIIAATQVDAIPIHSQNGADAVKIVGIDNNDDPVFEEIECKLAYFNKNRVMVADTKFNAIYAIPGPNKKEPNSYREVVSASYDIIHNLHKKQMQTYLVVMDEFSRKTICIYGMDSETIFNKLKYNGLTGEVKTSQKRSVSLSIFVNYGTNYNTENFAVTGLYNWENDIKKQANTIFYHKNRRYKIINNDIGA
jgi:hypothetical protein